MINLISDTVTKPTPAMLEAMMSAEVGDDVFREDPTVNALEEKAAKMFGMEAAVYCPSGTMTNQIAIRVHCRQLDEVICEQLAHIYQSETGGYASNSGVAIKLLPGKNGKLSPDQIEAAINPDYDWKPKSTLVSLENTCNIAGGSYYTVEEFKAIQKLCTDKNLKLHLDGARVFNALVETGETPEQIGSCFDSISICLSKGLGAPVGSLLLGNSAFIHQARRMRKVMGGGMRQAGFLAAAGLYALENNIDRLKTDNNRAKMLAEVLKKLNYIENIRPVKTNILIFDVKKPYTGTSFLEKLKQHDINAAAFGPQTIRFVTHLDVSDEMMNKTIEVLNQLSL